MGRWGGHLRHQIQVLDLTSRIEVPREGAGALFGRVRERRTVHLGRTLVLVLCQALRVLAGLWDLLQVQKDWSKCNVQSRSTE